MKSEWEVKPITNIVGFNPKHTVKKGALVSYVEMAAVPEHSREIAYFDNREFKSGSKFQNGDTLFSRITPCLQNGKTCRVSQLAKDEIANGSTEFIVMSAKNSIDKAFVYYLALSKEFRKYAEGRMEGTTGRQRVSWQSLSEYELPMPPKEIRKKISYTLSTLDDKIELNRRMNQTLEEMAQALFKSWFVDFDPVHAKNNATNDADYEQIAKELGISRKVLDLFPDKFEESELGMIPKGWKVGSLGDSDFSEIIGSGINKFTNEKIYLATADVADTNIINKETLITYENRASRANMQPINNSIWFAKMQNSRKLLMFDGNTDKTFSYILSTGFAGIRTTELSHYFIWTFVLSNSFNNSKNNLANGAVQVAINNSNIGKINYTKPANSILEIFNNITQDLFNKRQQNDFEIQTLKKTRDTLLPKLFSGELDVSELELDSVAH